MSNQVINPIIQHFSEDTLHSICDCLAYLSESGRPEVREDLSFQAKEGLQTILDCVKQAVKFEAERVKTVQKAPRFNDLSSFETSLFKRAYQDLEEGDSSLIAFVKPPSLD